jgi:diaminopimelate decarboxylase
VEAGRSIAAPSGLTLYTVGTIKEIRLPGGLGGEGGGLHTYVAVDGGMGDNPRVALYSAAYEAFLPARAGAERPFVATVAGRHCEQGDLLVIDAQLPEGVALGDVLATPVTGAYGHSMASTYNQMPRPAVVFVHDGRARVVVRRETFDDLVARDEDQGRDEGD